MFRLYESLHNLNMVLALQNFIVDRELYLDVVFYSQSEKTRRRRWRHVVYCTYLSNKAFSSLPHGAVDGRRSCAL